MTAVEKVPDRAAKPLQYNRFSQADHKFNRWSVIADREDTLEDICRAEFWRDVAKNLRPMDKIDVYSEDMTFYAELLVIEADRFWAKVHVLRKEDLAQVVNEASPEVFTVRWRGMHKRFGVVRVSDQTVLRDGFQNKEAAEMWKREHIKTIKV